MKRLLILTLTFLILLSVYVLRSCARVSENTVVFNETEPVLKAEIPTQAITYDIASQALVFESEKLDSDSGFDIIETDLYYRREYEIFLPITGELAQAETKVNNLYIEAFNTQYAEGGLKLTIKQRRIAAFDIFERNGKTFIKPIHPSDKYNKILLLDPGHGGYDDGAVSAAGIIEWRGSDRLIEKHYNLELAHKVEELLSNEPEIKVYLTRVEDVFVSLSDRREMRDYMADMFVSLHVNAAEFPAKNGLWTYYCANTGADDYGSDEFSLDMLYAVADTTGYTSYDIDHAVFAVLRGAKVPSTLVEVGFLSNTRDLRNLVRDEFMDQLANGIYNGIIEGFGRIK